eukprot:m.247153 g.247153  ORF g.247153 m.247153 type:complete len:401 (-) comp19491_c0_seq1:308-1510(-)
MALPRQSGAVTENLQSSTSAPLLLLSEDTDIHKFEFVRPVRERADAKKSLGFRFATVVLADGSGVTVVTEIDTEQEGIICPRFCHHEDEEERFPEGAELPKLSGVHVGDIIIKLNNLLMSEEVGELIHLLFRQAGMLDRIRVHVLRVQQSRARAAVLRGLKFVRQSCIMSITTISLATPLAFEASTSNGKNSKLLLQAKAEATRARAHATLAQALMKAHASEFKRGTTETHIMEALACLGIGQSDIALKIAEETLVEVRGHMSMDELHLLEILASAHLHRGNREGARDALQQCLVIAEMLSQHLSLARCLYTLGKLADEERLEQAGVLDGVLAFFDAAPIDDTTRTLYEQCLAAGKKLDPDDVAQQAQICVTLADAMHRLGREATSGGGTADSSSDCVIA